MISPARSASFVITLWGAVTNYFLFVNFFSTWRTFSPELESEWEASQGAWQVNVLKLLWGMLSVYFMAATAVCAAGFVGIVKNKPALVRFYRDYSVADFAFCALSTAIATYASLRTSSRADVCEELSRHPELTGDMLEMGLNLENCERWLERAVFAALGIMFIVMLIRLHFLLAVSSFYAQLARSTRVPLPLAASSSSPSPSSTMQRIFLLPSSHASNSTAREPDVEMVYTPVPLSSLPKEAQLSAREAWVSASQPAVSGAGEGSRHHRRSSRGSVVDREREQTGLIRLTIHPDEGLLPAYNGDAKA